MTEQETREKIVEVLKKSREEWEIITPSIGILDEPRVDIEIDKLADALIAAGIGDLKEHRIFAGKDGSIKQLYSGEEVEKMAKERKELKDELRSKVEYIHEQDEVIKEYKHRAEVAERALQNACEDIKQLMDCFIWAADGGVITINKYTPENATPQAYIDRTEKELAEERKDD